MLIIKKDVQDMLISAEIAITTQEVCPICGKPSVSSTGLCAEHFMQAMNEIEDIDTLDSWINREISIVKSFRKEQIK